MQMTFKNTGVPFSGYDACKEWIEANGYSYGSMQRGDPIGVVKGDASISKWRNLSKEDIAELDGQFQATSGSPRDDDMILTLKDDPRATDCQ